VSRFKGGGSSKVDLYQRAEEVIGYLFENNCATDLSKNEFAIALAARYGHRTWLLGDGTGNGKLVTEVCALTRDQALDPSAADICAGFQVTYSPNLGGMVLVDPTGEMSIEASLHILKGDLQRQQVTKTVNRRRVSNWNAVGHQALSSGLPDLARIAFQIEREIDSSGVCSDSLVDEFERLSWVILGGRAA